MDIKGGAVIGSASGNVASASGDVASGDVDVFVSIVIPDDILNHIMTYAAASTETCHGCLRRQKSAFPIRQGKFSYCSQACYNFT